MTIQVGDKLPQITVSTMTEEGPKPVSMDELCAGKKVVLFAVPGAFTPTCSAKHVPGFLEHAVAIQDKGVDQIVCLSVNDPFVMDAWAKDRGTENKILMLGDGNGDFTKAIDLSLDGSGFGLGARSQRYAMIVEDGTITTLEVEDGPGLSVSSAENILSKL